MNPKKRTLRTSLIFMEQSLALMEKECNTTIEVVEASTDNLHKDTVKNIKATMLALRQAIGTARRARECIHGTITVLLIEEEYNGCRKIGTNQESDTDNSDGWVNASFGIPEEEEE